MSNQIDNLKNIWQDARNKDYGESGDTDQIIEIAEKKIKSTIKMQVGTIIILVITLIGISLFFIYVAKFNQTLSHIGSGIMVGGLALRIIIELFSIHLSKKVNMSESALKTNNASLSYIQFRKRINGPVTFLIIVLYTIGFYLLTPEFSLYFSSPILIMIDLSYVLGAIIFTWFVRKAIRKEMAILNEILRIQNDITKEEQGEITKL